MCGIAGVFSPAGTIESNREVLERMAVALAHRGPDDGAVHCEPGIGLAHRRLSIIDLSAAGRQPMCNEDGTVWVAFNGEIYNYKDLRAPLERHGHRFMSNTDTEVIVHLYEEKGEEFLGELNGMFAIGLWDRKRRRMLVARDRLGVKPLVYFEADDGIVFASEIKALERHPRFDPTLDIEALELFFTFNFIPAPWTIYRNVKKLEPAHYLVIDNSGIRNRQYWNLASFAVKPLSGADARERVRCAVQESTRVRLFSDVPLGVFLSGGIDSSIVTAAAARATGGTLKTFCAGYPGTIFDERKYAAAVASMYGTDHTVLDISADEALDDIPRILDFFDEPFGDSSALPTFLISRLIRRHVTVALSGDGGDEVFGGYRRYLGELLIRYYLQVPSALRRNIIEPAIRMLPDSKDNKALELARRLKIFTAGSGNNQALRHYRWLAMFPDEDREALFTPGIKRLFESRGSTLISTIHASSRFDRFNRMLFTDTSFLLPFDMLTKVDWMSMFNSLEVRGPFLDYRLIELAFSISGKEKFKNFSLKSVLKKTFGAWLPRSVRRRPKQGFEVPVGEWFRTSERFKKLFRETVNAPHIERQGLFNAAYIDRLLEEHRMRRRDNTHKLWAIMVFQWWYESKGRRDGW